MPWTNLSSNYTNSPIGVLDFANSSTAGFFGGSIVAIVWLIAMMSTHDRNPKFSFVVAGFFAFIAGVLLKMMLASFSDVILLATFGSFVAPLMLIAFSRSQS